MKPTPSNVVYSFWGALWINGLIAIGNHFGSRRSGHFLMLQPAANEKFRWVALLLSTRNGACQKTFAKILDAAY